jgi:hypothetical protein
MRGANVTAGADGQKAQYEQQSRACVEHLHPTITGPDRRERMMKVHETKSVDVQNCPRRRLFGKARTGGERHQ